LVLNQQPDTSAVAHDFNLSFLFFLQDVSDVFQPGLLTLAVAEVDVDDGFQQGFAFFGRFDTISYY